MAQQVIDIGTALNAGDGEGLRPGADKINDNFTELYLADPGALRYVDATNGDDGADGFGWATAFATIGAAAADLGTAGTIIFVGDETLTAALALSIAGITIQGLGRHASRLLTDDFNDDMIVVTAADVKLADLSLVGGAAGTVLDATGTLSGILIDDDAHRFIMQDCYLTNMGQSGVKLNAATTSVDDVHLFRNRYTLCGKHAIEGVDAAVRLNVKYERIWAIVSDGINLATDCTDAQLHGNKFKTIGGKFVVGSLGAHRMSILNNQGDGAAAEGVDLDDCDSSKCSKNTWRNTVDAAMKFANLRGIVANTNTVNTVTGDGRGIELDTVEAAVIGPQTMTGVVDALVYNDLSFSSLNGLNVKEPSGNGIEQLSGTNIDNLIGEIIIDTPGGSGLVLTAGTLSASRLHDIQVVDPTGDGVVLFDCADVAADDIQVRDTLSSTARGIVISGALTGSVFLRRPVVLGFDGAGGDAVELEASLDASAKLYLERLFAPDATNKITDSSGGDANVYHRRHYSAVSENKGTATLANGTTSIVVSHGLMATPVIQDIYITPIEAWGSMTEWYIDTITATQFTIHADADPGQDVDFVWQAEL